MATAATPRASWAGRAIRVLMAPATWVERARGRRRWALLALYTLILAIPSPWVVRSLSLRGLDDPGDPFDVAAFRARWDVPEADNARLGYERAAALLVQPDPPYGPRGPLGGPSAESWVLMNRAALGSWLEATAQPAYAAVKIVPDDRAVARRRLDHRALIRLGELEAERLGELGAVAEAWDYHLGLLRHSLHLACSDLASDRLDAGSHWYRAQVAATSWARDLAVGPADLRRALADLQALGPRLPPASDGYKVQYLDTLAKIDSPPQLVVDAARRELDGRLPTDSMLAQMSGISGLRWFVQDDQERSRRVLRQIYAGELPAADAPVPPTDPLGPTPPRRAAPSPAAAVGLGSTALARWYESTLILRQLAWDATYLRQEAADRRADHGRLIVTIAEELFRRDRGGYPASPAELVGPYLDALPEGVDPDESGLIDDKTERPRAAPGLRAPMPRIP